MDQRSTIGRARTKKAVAAAAIAGALALTTAVPAFAMHPITFGTSGPDNLRGTSASDDLRGLGGGDFLRGLGGNDMLRGGSGSDYVDGHYGNDYIYGGLGDDAASYTAKAGLHGDSPSMKADSSKDGDDRIYGQSGSDSLYGYGGSDLLVGGAGREDLIIATEERFPPDADGGASPVPSKNPGEDIVRGGAGRDHIYAQDGYKDTIDCGDGIDSVMFDKGLDIVASNCEQKNVVG